jgi:hypothetical protein
MAAGRDEIPNFYFSEDLRKSFKELDEFGFSGAAWRNARPEDYPITPPTPTPPPTFPPCWDKIEKHQQKLIRTRYRVTKIVLDPLPDAAAVAVGGVDGIQLLPEFRGPAEDTKVAGVFLVNGVRYTLGAKAGLSPADPCILPHEIEIDGKLYQRTSR